MSCNRYILAALSLILFFLVNSIKNTFVFSFHCFYKNKKVFFYYFFLVQTLLSYFVVTYVKKMNILIKFGIISLFELRNSNLIIFRGLLASVVHRAVLKSHNLMQNSISASLNKLFVLLPFFHKKRMHCKSR